jgi:hypothetical protein
MLPKNIVMVLDNMSGRVTVFPEDVHKNNGRNMNELPLYFSSVLILSKRHYGLIV